MRTEKEIIKKRKECLRLGWSKQYDKHEVPEADYFSGAWHALMWVTELEEDI